MGPPGRSRIAFAAFVLASLAAAGPPTVAAAAQDTTAIKALAGRTKQDQDSILSATKISNAQVQKNNRAETRVRSRQDSIVTAMRKDVTPPAGPASIVVTPSTLGLAIDATAQLTARVLDASGASVVSPVTWTSSAPAVASVTTSGLVAALTGGTARVTASTTGGVHTDVAVAVAENPPPPPDDSIPTPPVIGFDGPAELPRIQVARAAPSCTATVPVTSGMDLQAAINMVQPGACLLLAPGATFTGNFILPAKGSTAWVTIVTQATLPPAGTRMTPGQAAALKLAKIMTPGYGAAITWAQGATHYRLRALEISGSANSETTGINMLVDLRNTSRTFSASTAPGFSQLEQLYVHGTSTMELRRCIWMDGYVTSVVDSWVSDCHSNNSDSQAGLHGAGARGILWENNHLEAGHEIVMFGGFDAPDSTLSPQDITIRRNHIVRPPSWKGVWQVKNLIESKNARRLLLEGNVLENSWPDAQAGFMFVLKSENQGGGAPWTTSSDFVIRYNTVRGGAGGFNVAEFGSNGTPAQPSSRHSYHDNLIDEMGKWGGQAIAMQSLGATRQVEYRHNTFLNGLQSWTSNQAISFDGASAIRAVWDGNVMGNGTYGVKGAGTASGTATLNQYASGAVFTLNAIVKGSCATFPAGNTCPLTAPASTATTGADMTLLAQLTAGVVVPSGLPALRARARRAPKLKYPHPDTPPGCQVPKPKQRCDDPPMRLSDQ